MTVRGSIGGLALTIVVLCPFPLATGCASPDDVVAQALMLDDDSAMPSPVLDASEPGPNPSLDGGTDADGGDFSMGCNITEKVGQLQIPPDSLRILVDCRTALAWPVSGQGQASDNDLAATFEVLLSNPPLPRPAPGSRDEAVCDAGYPGYPDNYLLPTAGTLCPAVCQTFRGWLASAILAACNQRERAKTSPLFQASLDDDDAGMPMF